VRVPFLDLKREYKQIKKEVLKKFLTVLDKGEYCYGEETEKFEKSFAKLTGCRYCFGLGSGTDSLMIALKASGIKPGDKVITTTFSFIATVEAIINVGAYPVLIDIDQETMNFDLEKVVQKIDKKTKAIIPVHLYGVTVDMDKLLNIVRKYKLAIIQDAAHAEGSRYKGKPVSSFGDVSCFSLYPSKSLGAYGNAGAISTNKKIIAHQIRMISNHGRDRDKNIHQVIGYTGTIDNLQSAVLNIKLKYFSQNIRRKKMIAREYNRAFANLPFKSQKIPSFCDPSFYVYTIRFDKRDKLKEFLAKNGVGTGIYYPFPLHLQPSLQFLGYKKGDFPIAEQTAASVLSLPLYPQMTDKEVEYVIQKVKAFFV
jgi:dTDP-4-amino-4,6-dideoxygalactose transaminase